MSSADRRNNDQPASLEEFFQSPEQLGTHPVWPTIGMVRRNQREIDELRAGIGVIGAANDDMPWPWEVQPETPIQPQAPTKVRGKGRARIR